MEDEHVMKPVAGDEEHRNGTPAPMEITVEECEIDRVLADSFPASDSPPWTLGVGREPDQPAPTQTWKSTPSHRSLSGQ